MKRSIESRGPKTWDTFFALDVFDTYRQQIERMINTDAISAINLHGPTWVATSEQEKHEWEWERQEAKRMHDEVLFPTFRYSLVVSLYSLYETEFVRVVEVAEKDHQQGLRRSDLAGDAVSQCIKYLEVFEKIKNLNGWTSMKQINEMRLVRNCIVHCNAEVSRSSQKKKLLEKWGGNGSYESDGVLCINGMRIDLTDKFLSSRFVATWQFFLKLFESLDWVVAANWKSKDVRAGDLCKER